MPTSSRTALRFPHRFAFDVVGNGLAYSVFSFADIVRFGTVKTVPYGCDVGFRYGVHPVPAHRRGIGRTQFAPTKMTGWVEILSLRGAKRRGNPFAPLSIFTAASNLHHPTDTVGDDAHIVPHRFAFFTPFRR